MDQHDDKILGLVRRQERNLLRSISWLSLCIAILYVCGYVWRSCYYSRLGILVSMIDFPFHQLLVPKTPTYLFAANAFFWIAYKSYSSFFIKSKRLRRAKTMAIDAPIDMLHDYAMQPHLRSPEKDNYHVLIDFLEDYIHTNSKDDPQGQFERAEFDNEALELFPDIPSELRSSFISYSIQLCLMDKAERHQTLKDVLGYPAQGLKIYGNPSQLFGY